MYFDSIDQLREKLTYHDVKGDEYWSCEGLIFELFFSAGKDGPTKRQLLTYLDFQQESVLYIDAIRERVIDGLERETGKAPSRFYREIPFVDVVNINPEDAENTMDIVLSFRTFRFLFYSRWMTYVVKFRGRNLVSAEPSESRYQ